MASWEETPDPANQVESRNIPFSSKVISESSIMHIPATLYQDLGKSSRTAKSVFDMLAMRMSYVFPGWKGTRCDFRFGDHENIRVFVLTPKREFIRVEIRTDVTGYRDNEGLFPKTPAPSSKYPGNWIRANVSGLSEASAIANDIEKQLS